MLTKTVPHSSLNFQNIMLMPEVNKPISIFLLDDHRLFSQVVKSLLDQVEGFEVVDQAYTIKDGIAKIAVLRPDMVLLDHHLPDGNGVEAAAMILKKHPGTKIIFLTIEQDHAIMESAVKAGAKGYLLKETGSEELLNAIAEVLAGRTAVSPRLRRKEDSKFNQQLAHLSKREKQIALLIGKGLQSAQIANALHISEHTVTTHRKNIMRKLGVHNSIQLAKVVL